MLDRAQQFQFAFVALAAVALKARRQVVFSGAVDDYIAAPSRSQSAEHVNELESALLATGSKGVECDTFHRFKKYFLESSCLRLTVLITVRDEWRLTCAFWGLLVRFRHRERSNTLA